jgi:hypothetical protein
MRRLSLAVLVLAGLLATSLNATAQADPNAQGRVIGVQLGPDQEATNGFPSLDQVLIRDQPLLNAFARQYARDTREPNVENFMMWWLNNRLFAIAAGKAKPPRGFRGALDMSTDAGLKRALWLTHVVGNNTGAWYHYTLDEFGPCRCTGAANNAFYEAQVPGELAAAKAANHSSGNDLFAYDLSTVRSPTGSPFAGQLGFYGYDTSFTLAQTVPPGAPVPPVIANPFAPKPWVSWDGGSNATTCQSPSCLLDATYAIDDPPFLRAARGVFAAMLNGNAEVQARLQRAIVGNGTAADNLYTQMNAGLGLGLQGVPSGTFANWTSQADFNILLYAQTYTGMYNQAVAMSGLVAVATHDAALGHIAAREQQLWNGYSGGYGATVGDPAFNWTPDSTVASVQAKFIYAK